MPGRYLQNLHHSLSRNMISHVSTSSVKEISVSTTSTSPKSTILSRIVSRAATPSVKDTSVSTTTNARVISPKLSTLSWIMISHVSTPSVKDTSVSTTTNARVISPKLSTLSWIMISHVSTPSVKETTTKTSTNARGISPKSSVILSQIGNHVSTPSVKVGSHDDEDDDIFDVPTAKGQHIITLLCINIGICICILVGIFIFIKDKIKKHLCIFKRWKIYKPSKKNKLPSVSEIELNRMKAISSFSDDNDNDSIFDISES
ncbi:uncharacterized protein LOC111115871 isoform X2 [Crassostrea virginica]